MLVVALALAGCGRARPRTPPRPPTEEPLQARCPAPTQGPTYCEPTGDVPERFVVGLAPGHGWERRDRVELRDAEGERVAYVEVAEAYSTSVKVGAAVQRRAVDLAGMTARKVPSEEALRLGKHFGRVLDVRGGRVRLDLGRADGLVVGDSYAVLGPQWNAEELGRVRVTEVEDMVAWAVVDVERTTLHLGLEVRLVQGAVFGPAANVTVLVANFDADDATERTRSFGRVFAKRFAADLREAAKGVSGWTVRYEETATVRLGVPEAEAHAQAKEIGLRMGADLVVWGSLRCSDEACALPRFTAVRPERFGTAAGQGLEVWRELDRGGLAPQQGAAEAMALLGTLTYEAQRYGDAAYYLQKALADGGVGREDALRMRMRLAYAAFTVGQLDVARKAAQVLAQDDDAFWQRRGEAELARIEMRTGDNISARRRLQALVVSRDGKPYALHMLAMLDAKEGRVDDARDLYAQSLELMRRISDVQGEAHALFQLARLEAQQGKVDDARRLYTQSIALARDIGDVQGEAAYLHELAALDFASGKDDEARKLYEQALEISRKSGDVRGEAGSLAKLAELERSAGALGGARRLLEKSKELFEQSGDIEGLLQVRLHTAMIDLKAGQIRDAQQKVREVIALSREHSFVNLTADAYALMGLTYELAGDTSAARAEWTEALKLYQQLQMETEITVLQGLLAK